MNRFLAFFLIFSGILFAGVQQLSAQKKQKVNIEHADILRFDQRQGQNLQKLIGNVIMRQEDTRFYCDSAFLDNNTNHMRAFGHVHIAYNDTLDAWGDYLVYDGNSKVAVLDSNVRLDDKSMILTTDHLTYNRINEWAYYNTGGEIIDEDNVLTSKTGRYYTSSREFFFQDSVLLVNPDFVMRSDTLMYNTDTEISYISGPTTIDGENEHIYTEYGWYDTKSDITQLLKNNFIRNGEQSLQADSIFYDRGRKFGDAFRNVVLNDTLQDVVITGEYSMFDRHNGSYFITDSVTAMLIDETDTLFLHADTIRMISDQDGKARELRAYYRMKFFRKDLQGKCDSLVYQVQDSVIFLYGEPVLWSDENQLTADSILIFVTSNQVDSLSMFSSAFIISLDDSVNFNQIKGRAMTAYFARNELNSIMVSGNAETLYFVREEDSTLIGFNKSLASYMRIGLLESKVNSITYIERPDATLFPIEEISDDQRFLKGYIWHAAIRPGNREDIYNW